MDVEGPRPAAANDQKAKPLQTSSARGGAGGDRLSGNEEQELDSLMCVSGGDGDGDDDDSDDKWRPPATIAAAAHGGEAAAASASTAAASASTAAASASTAAASASTAAAAWGDAGGDRLSGDEEQELDSLMCVSGGDGDDDDDGDSDDKWRPPAAASTLPKAKVTKADRKRIQQEKKDTVKAAKLAEANEKAEEAIFKLSRTIVRWVSTSPKPSHGTLELVPLKLHGHLEEYRLAISTKVCGSVGVRMEAVIQGRFIFFQGVLEVILTATGQVGKRGVIESRKHMNETNQMITFLLRPVGGSGEGKRRLSEDCVYATLDKFPHIVDADKLEDFEIKKFSAGPNAGVGKTVLPYVLSFLYSMGRPEQVLVIKTQSFISISDLKKDSGSKKGSGSGRGDLWMQLPGQDALNLHPGRSDLSFEPGPDHPNRGLLKGQWLAALFNRGGVNVKNDLNTKCIHDTEQVETLKPLSMKQVTSLYEKQRQRIGDASAGEGFKQGDLLLLRDHLQPRNIIYKAHLTLQAENDVIEERRQEEEEVKSAELLQKSQTEKETLQIENCQQLMKYQLLDIENKRLKKAIIGANIGKKKERTKLQQAVRERDAAHAEATKYQNEATETATKLQQAVRDTATAQAEAKKYENESTDTTEKLRLERRRTRDDSREFEKLKKSNTTLKKKNATLETEHQLHAASLGEIYQKHKSELEKQSREHKAALVEKQKQHEACREEWAKKLAETQTLLTNGKEEVANSRGLVSATDRVAAFWKKGALRARAFSVRPRWLHRDIAKTAVGENNELDTQKSNPTHFGLGKKRLRARRENKTEIQRRDDNTWRTISKEAELAYTISMGTKPGATTELQADILERRKEQLILTEKRRREALDLAAAAAREDGGGFAADAEELDDADAEELDDDEEEEAGWDGTIAAQLGRLRLDSPAAMDVTGGGGGGGGGAGRAAGPLDPYIPPEPSLEEIKAAKDQANDQASTLMSAYFKDGICRNTSRETLFDSILKLTKLTVHPVAYEGSIKVKVDAVALHDPGPHAVDNDIEAWVRSKLVLPGGQYAYGRTCFFCPSPRLAAFHALTSARPASLHSQTHAQGGATAAEEDARGGRQAGARSHQDSPLVGPPQRHGGGILVPERAPHRL